jgi:hypothetical protein
LAGIRGIMTRPKAPADGLSNSVLRSLLEPLRFGPFLRRQRRVPCADRCEEKLQLPHFRPECNLACPRLKISECKSVDEYE